MNFEAKKSIKKFLSAYSKEQLIILFYFVIFMWLPLCKKMAYQIGSERYWILMCFNAHRISFKFLKKYSSFSVYNIYVLFHFHQNMINVAMHLIILKLV